MKNSENQISKFISDIRDGSPNAVDERVLAAMSTVDRALFVPKEKKALAYELAVIPLDGYTLSEPRLVAFMIQALELNSSDIVLDIGSGSGYHAAIMSRLCKKVYGVEVLPDAARRSRLALQAAHCLNVEINCSDGWDGWPEHAPYDAVNVACAASQVPVTILQQMTVGARMIIPLSTHSNDLSESQSLCLITKKGETPFNDPEKTPYEIDKLIAVRFVPMVHSHH
jgi:protein-L-isoaspartate(D-aspartate) O-methyltransferase